MVDPDALEVPENLEPRIIPILVWPDERLHQKCEDITTFDSWIKQHAVDLLATMKHSNGVGLASPQVGVLANIIAIWIEEKNPMVFVNPKIIEAGDEEFEWDEGCLSVPGYFEKRRRPNRIVLQYKDIDGNEHETEFRQLYAFAIQHEMDHLKGKLFIDGLSTFKLSRVKNKVQKFLKRLSKKS